MSDDTDEADDERATELNTISAIYPELLIDPSNPFTATIDLPVEPVQPFFASFPQTSDGAQPGLPTPPDSDGRSGSLTDDAGLDGHSRPATHAAVEVHELSHLPPVQLRIHLPPTYPIEQPPQLKLVSEIPWLSKVALERLESEGKKLWEEMGHSQVLFAYIDYLREAAEEAFGLTSTRTDAVSIAAELRIGLLDYDLKAKQATFESATFECGVCLEPKKGAVCHRMTLCGHVFCVECLQDFYNNCITEGDTGSVKCIMPRCGLDEKISMARDGALKKRRRRDRTLGPSELLQIPLEQNMVQRYVMLKRKNALESDRTTVYCPRQWCQGPARSKKTEALDRDDDLASGDETQEELALGQQEDNNGPSGQSQSTDRLAICTECTYAFCKVCKAGWHGDFIVCDPKRKAKLTAEEEASEEYIRLHTSHCPTCNAKSQKTHGCNHMICIKCNTHFCYLCSSWLAPNNPYEHFNNPKKACFQRLWELEAGDGDDVGRGFAGGYEPNDDNDDDNDFDGQNENPPVDLDDIDSNDEAEHRAPVAPAALPLRNHRRRRDIVVRLPPPPRVQAAIARRAAAAGVHQPPPQPQINQVEQVIAPPPQPPGAAAPRAPVEGLQRFLEMVQNDEEDEWDSDELGDESDDEDFWRIPFR
ncbi:MAG: hypothetical protein Q9209_005883 [Squamulea sp. 1 TL-2023]